MSAFNSVILVVNNSKIEAYFSFNITPKNKLSGQNLLVACRVVQSKSRKYISKRHKLWRFMPCTGSRTNTNLLRFLSQQQLQKGNLFFIPTPPVSYFSPTVLIFKALNGHHHSHREMYIRRFVYWQNIAKCFPWLSRQTPCDLQYSCTVSIVTVSFYATLCKNSGLSRSLMVCFGKNGVLSVKWLGCLVNFNEFFITSINELLVCLS